MFDIVILWLNLIHIITIICAEEPYLWLKCDLSDNTKLGGHVHFMTRGGGGYALVLIALLK